MPNLLQGDRDRESYDVIFQSFLNDKFNKFYSINGFFGSVFAERFNRPIRDLLEKPVFESWDGNCVDIIPTWTKRYNNRIHSST